MTSRRAPASHGSWIALAVIGQYLDQLQQVADRLGAPLVPGRTGQATREERFAAFRDGELPVLVMFARVLDMVRSPCWHRRAAGCIPTELLLRE